ncbi:hypothetical protein GGI25_004751 [Coemansia spiralis]|uniref:Uncharacterized protein n=2 Tax=Coemansia TaxID=4863 RepID=A0A9W8FZW6_9FUNG|nr:transferase family-domain-containing protein [Coemansia spiralis]KAJ1989725.1 hypothetical protein EDC05_004523 [Coemansia umbellata]KAJ2620532.1 hypothetical protein GGI26_004939 [Coemansia sp. RSA 1358]KAJ2673416.1 hypothetical protein GGI25_004751 [Coemansia spiralis]
MSGTIVDNKESKGGSGKSTIVFCPADNAIFPRAMIHFYFHNPDETPDFMNFAVLKESFYKTLCTSMPLALATDMRQTSTKHGGLTATLSSIPDYPLVTKHVDNEHTVEKMIAKKFSLCSQPPAIVNVPSFANPLAGDPLVTLDIVYMCDGVGFALALSHAIADMPALITVVQEWSQMAKSMFNSNQQVYQSEKLDFDREWFWKSACAFPPGTFVDFDRHMDEVAAIAPGNDSVESEACHPHTSVYRLSISPKSVETLRSTRPDGCKDISVAALITAILWQSHSLANPKSQYTYLGSSITIRSTPEFARFCGNTATMDYLYYESAQLNAMPIADISKAIQARNQSFSVGDFVRCVENYSECAYMERYSNVTDSKHAAKIIVINISRLPSYNVDFGYGAPVKFVYPAKSTPPGFCIILPHNKLGGMDIYANLTSSVIENIASAEFLNGHVEIMKYQ